MSKTQRYNVGCACRFCGSLNVRPSGDRLTCDSCGSVWSLLLVLGQAEPIKGSRNVTRIRGYSGSR